MEPEPLYHIKARQKSKRQWGFVTAGGTINHLRVYAKPFYAQFVDEALRVLAEDNPEFEFKKQAIR